MEMEIQTIYGVPDDKVAEVDIINPRYVSHKVIPEGGGANTIEITLRKEVNMETEIQTIHGVPDDKVQEQVDILKANPRYVSHKVISEGGGTNTIEATLRVDE